MLGTILNGSSGLLGLWADCKVGKSNPVVFSSLSLLKKKHFCMPPLLSRCPHKSTHAALLVRFQKIMSGLCSYSRHSSLKPPDAASRRTPGNSPHRPLNKCNCHVPRMPLLFCVTAYILAASRRKTAPRENSCTFIPLGRIK